MGQGRADTTCLDRSRQTSLWLIQNAEKQGDLQIAADERELRIDPAAPMNAQLSRLSQEADALAAEKLQLFHKDPFDRMLIAQALMGGLAIVTSDRAFEPYPVRVIW